MTANLEKEEVMKTITQQLPALLFFLIIITVTGQDLPKNSVEGIFKEYNDRAGRAKVLTNCGHALDVSTYWAKEMENASLDAMLPLTTAQQKKIGKEIYHQIAGSNKEARNHPFEKDILLMIKRLSGEMKPEEYRTFHLTILDLDEINAFTSMGGYIYLTTGLLEFINSYDELAFILGHEIGHEVKSHTRRKVTKVLLTSAALTKAQLEDFQQVALSMNTRFSAPFDQIDEYEADRYGVELAQKAGYDTGRFLDFFNKMEAYEKQDLLNKLTSTHPFAKHRKNCINTYLQR